MAAVVVAGGFSPLPVNTNLFAIINACKAREPEQRRRSDHWKETVSKRARRRVLSSPRESRRLWTSHHRPTSESGGQSQSAGSRLENRQASHRKSFASSLAKRRNRAPSPFPPSLTSLFADLFWAWKRPPLCTRFVLINAIGHARLSDVYLD